MRRVAVHKGQKSEIGSQLRSYLYGPSNVKYMTVPEPSSSVKVPRGVRVLQIFTAVVALVIVIYTALLLIAALDPTYVYEDGFANKATTISFLAFNALFGIALLLGAWAMNRPRPWAWYLITLLVSINVLYSLWPVVSIFGLVMSGMFFLLLWRERGFFIKSPELKSERAQEPENTKNLP